MMMRNTDKIQYRNTLAHKDNNPLLSYCKWLNIHQSKVYNHHHIRLGSPRMPVLLHNGKVY
jgi:hypothetical protein